MAGARLRGVVALDGPSGTGKSTVARRLAGALDAGYLDTGAMYRAVTLAVLRAGVDVTDGPRAAVVAGQARLRLGTGPGRPLVELNGQDVTAEIRDAPVTEAVSAVSAVADIRELLVAEQRRIVASVLQVRGGIVVEGRDIGTVVVPDAAFKVYLSASADARARRRRKQDSVAGRAATLQDTRADVQRRDTADSGRAASPLRKADDAVELDTTVLDAWGVVRRLLAMLEERGLAVVAQGSRR